MSSNFTVIYDSNILFGSFLRNVMIHLAQAGIYRAKWTNDIHNEWMPRLMEKYPNVRVEDAQRIRGLIDASVPDCLVYGYKRIIPGLELPDAKDRHVLAAAIKAGAQVIVTRNISHFPHKILSEFDIEAQHPDDFILYQKDENLPAVIEQLRNCRMVLKKPPLSMDEFIEKFRKSDLQLTANWLAEIRSLFESSA
jgi:hypothetical protein